MLEMIERDCGGLESFSRGYETRGLVAHPDGSITYREWAPGASEAYLMGDFSNQIYIFRRY